MYVLSKNIRNIEIFQMKLFNFDAEKNGVFS